MNLNPIEASEQSAKPNADRIMLIDLENCPGQIYQLMKDLQHYSHVVVCYAQSGAKIPLDWLMSLNPLINDNRLRIVKMPCVGKNAANDALHYRVQRYRSGSCGQFVDKPAEDGGKNRRGEGNSGGSNGNQRTESRFSGSSD